MLNCKSFINFQLNPLRSACCASTKVPLKKKKNLKKVNNNPFTETVFLPETKFPLLEDEVVYEKKILSSGLIDQLYEQQQARQNVKVFDFLDGPPYSNGDLHVGHAINKTLKDIFCRYYVNRGFKVNFRLGWDTHGLPIELKAIKNNETRLDPISIRDRSREFALNTLDKQLNSFRRYGVMADFKDPYITCKDDYVTNQIDGFFKLYEKNLIEKKYSPIYWSPSSKSALAESELEYNNQHQGYSSYFKFKIFKTKLESKLQFKLDKQLNALIWTTTPWTIPSNMAISFSRKLNYVIVQSTANTDELFLINPKSIERLEQELECKFEIIRLVNGELLDNLTYEHPLKKQVQQPFIDCDFVDEDKGTGLIHCAPNHGHEGMLFIIVCDFLGLNFSLSSILYLDYLLFTSKNLEIEDCLVDENGRFNEHVSKYLPSSAIGLNIFKEGSDFVLEFMKNNVFKASTYEHSYPYDWRTKLPVFTTVKNQFFMNINTIKDQCLEEIDRVNFIPEQFVGALKTNINKRTEWCISRQRAWGVPIPAFYSNEDQDKIRPIIKKELISQINRLILERGSNCWWLKDNLNDFLPDQLLREIQLNGNFNDYFREKDILDVWFDSGMAWNYVLKENEQNLRKADLILEGQDQLR